MKSLYIKTLPQWVRKLADVSLQLFQFFSFAKTARVGKSYFLAVGLLLASPAAFSVTPPGNVLDFNNSNQYVTVPNASSLITTPGNTMTIMGWVYPRSVLPSNWSDADGIIGFRNNSDADFYLLQTPSTGIEARFGNSSGVTSTITMAAYAGTADILAVNQWQHLALTYDGASLGLYLNGIQIGNTLASGVITNGSVPFNLGNITNDYLNGQLDEVSFWNVALTQAQIQTNMYNPLAGSETGLMAYYNFDQTTGTTLSDVKGHDGTLTNMVGTEWTTSGAMCPFPISASNATTTSFTANWNAVSGATGYRLDVSTDPNFGSFLTNGNNIAMPVGTSSNVTGLTLTPGTLYYYRMRVETGAWTSPNSATVSFMVSPGNALTLDGLNDYVRIPYSAGLNVYQKFTIEFWIKPENLLPRQEIILNRHSDVGVDSLSLECNINNGVLNCFDVGNPIVSYNLTDIGIWHHVAFTYDGTTFNLFIDGNQKASQTGIATSCTNPWRIGSTWNGTYPLDGSLDEIRIWNVARTQTQIQSNLNKTLVGNEANLVAYYNFDQTSGTTLPDVTGHGHNGTLVNGPSWTAATWKYGYPYVTTGTVSALTATTASVGGTVVDTGTSAVTASGICYATSASPTTPCTTDGPTGIGSIPGSLTGLTPQGITYYARAYATNSAGTIYSYDSEVTLTTRYLPVIAQGTSVSVTMDEEGSPTAWSTPTISATDTESDTMTWTLATPATNGTAIVSGTGASPTLTYSPTANYNGADSFVVQVADIDGVATMTVNVTINPINDAPVASASSFTTTENTVLNQTWFASDIEADPLTYSIVTNGSKGSATMTNASTGAFTYTPNANQNGTDTITFKVNDGTMDSNPGTITITITPAPPPSVIPPPAPVIPTPVLVPPLPPMTLTLSLDGTGTGRLTSDPVGIDCSPTAAACAYTVTTPTWVTLTATPGEGSQLSHWSGDSACQTEGKVFVMADTACVATFDLNYYTLTVEKNAPAATVTGEGMNCPDACQATYLYGTTVKLEASKAPLEWEFVGWGGACDSQGQVILTADKVCRAQYQEDPNIPALGDGNGDGILDARQPNVISLPDKVTGRYVTFAVQPETCVISDVYTDLPDNYGKPEKNKPMPQGLIYFELACPQAQISLYYHAVSTVKRNVIFRKFGPLVPGNEQTAAWYLLPNVTFEAVMIGGKSVVKASYTLKDGELGDSTEVDGRIVDPGGIVVE